MPQVSILIRSMDRPWLPRALASVAAQRDVDMEVVVLASCGARHRALPATCGVHPLRLVVPDVPLQRSAAANAAIAAARGEYLNFLDDDDEFLPDHVATLLDALRRTPGARLAHAQAQLVDASGQVVGTLGSPVKPWLQLENGFIQFGCALFARSLIDDGARVDERLEILEDMDFFVQCAQLTPFAYVPRATSRYHIDAGDSGASIGTGHDPARVATAMAYLREKWAASIPTWRALPRARLERGAEALRDGRDDDAVALLVPLIDELPDDVNVLNLAGVALMRTGRADLATTVLRRALVVIPGQPQVAANLEIAERRLSERQVTGPRRSPG